MKRPKAIRRIPYIDPLPSKTDQSFRNEVNVNSIMAKYFKGKQITHLSKRQGMFADVSAIPDLQEAFAKVADANSAFAQLPAELRQKLNNDPRNLTDFLINPKNEELAREYGLLNPKKPTDEVPSSVKTTQSAAPTGDAK